MVVQERGKVAGVGMAAMIRNKRSEASRTFMLNVKGMGRGMIEAVQKSQLNVLGAERFQTTELSVYVGRASLQTEKGRGSLAFTKVAMFKAKRGFERHHPSCTDMRFQLPCIVSGQFWWKSKENPGPFAEHGVVKCRDQEPARFRPRICAWEETRH